MRTITVYDDRFGTKLIGTHENVPSEWTKKDILERFGIGEHLRVVQLLDGQRRTLQPGDQPGR